MAFYVLLADDTEPKGPFEVEEIVSHIGLGWIGSGARVKTGGSNEWIPIEKIPVLSNAMAEHAKAPDREPSNVSQFPWPAIVFSFLGASVLIVLIMFAFPSEGVQQTEVKPPPSGTSNAVNQQMLAMEEAVQAYKLIVHERGLSSCTLEVYPVGELVAACKQTVAQCVREAERAFRRGDGKQHSVDLAAAAYERCFLPTMTRNMTPRSATSAPPSVQRFLAWYDKVAPTATKNPKAITGSADVTCYNLDDSVESARGLCMADVVVNDDSSTHSLNWAKADPSAFKAQVILVGLPQALNCEHLGGALNRVEQGTQICDMTDGSGASIFSTGSVKGVDRFTKQYLTYDPRLEQ